MTHTGCDCVCHGAGGPYKPACAHPDGTPIDGGCGLVHHWPAAGAAATTVSRRLAEEIAFDVAELVGYLPRLADLLEPANSPIGGSLGSGWRGKKVTGSPPPWNDAVAMLVMDIHAGARQLEDALTLLAHGHRRRPPRSASDAQTVNALRALPDLAQLCRDRSPDHNLPGRAGRAVYGWAVAARRELDETRPEEAPWTRAPGGLRCPNQLPDGTMCEQPLWLAPGAATTAEPPVYCRRCTDDSGQLLSWPWGAWKLAAELGPTRRRTARPGPA